MSPTAWIVLGGFVWVLVLLYRISRRLEGQAERLKASQPGPSPVAQASLPARKERSALRTFVIIMLAVVAAQLVVRLPWGDVAAIVLMLVLGVVEFVSSRSFLRGAAVVTVCFLGMLLWGALMDYSHRWRAEKKKQAEERRWKAELTAKLDAAESWAKQNPGSPLPEDHKAGIAPSFVDFLENEAKQQAQPEGGEPKGPESEG